MERGDREIVLKAINLFKRNKFRFQKIWLILSIEEGIPLHEFMDFKAFIKSYFGCLNREAQTLIQVIEGEFKSMKAKK
tara:strand:+ start:2532 stop:2765 length:234 start_codon:yes stop_codon:yes gene_type:complete